MDWFTWKRIRDLEEYRDLHATRDAIRARAASHLAAVKRERVEALEKEVAWLQLLARSLAELCLEKGVITEDELRERLKKIDLADGVEVGKAGPGPGVPAPPPPSPAKPVRRKRFRPRV